MNRELVLIAHNLRSCLNVGSLLRTAEGLGITKVWLTGYTPYPRAPSDSRLPHIAQKLDRQITKASLGAELTVEWAHQNDIYSLINSLKLEGFIVAALEQTEQAFSLPQFIPPAKLALIVGREVEGLEREVLEQAEAHLAIPMLGQKESFNVVQAAAMALYHCRFL